MRIALLPARSMIDRLFTADDLDELATLADVVPNDTEAENPETVATLAHDADTVVTSWGSPQFTDELLQRLPNLSLVIHAAGSIKPIVSPVLWDRGIRVSSGHGPLGRGVAETAVGLTITSIKNLWRLSTDIAAGGWNEQKANVRELYGQTIGVLGAGKAGRHYIQLMHSFQVDILLYDPTLTATEVEVLGAKKSSLENLLRQSDVISVHAPAIPATHHMLNSQRLGEMKDGAILINTARGTIIDEAALTNELRTGRIFACLDVTDPEPPASDHPFRNLPNCVLTGHVAGAVNNGLHRLGRYVVDEIRRYKSNQDLDGEQHESRLSASA